MFTDAPKHIDAPKQAESRTERVDPDKRIRPSGVFDSVKRFFDPDRRADKQYTDREKRIAQAKGTDCIWIKDPGESRAIPRIETDEGSAVAKILARFGLEGIRYKDGKPDFSKCALASVTIEGMTENRVHVIDKNDPGNYRRACEALAKKWDQEKPKPNGDCWKPQEIRYWARANGLTIHECSDMKTVQFVPKEIHSYFKHYGGVAECKARDKAKESGNSNEQEA